MLDMRLYQSAGSSTVSYEFYDASSVQDESLSLGSFLDVQNAKAREIENARNFDKSSFTPSRPIGSSYDFESSLSNPYIERDEDFYKELQL